MGEKSHNFRFEYSSIRTKREGEGSKSFAFRASCFGYFGYQSKVCPSETPFSTLLDYSTNLARVSEEKAGKELKLIKGGYISENIFNVETRLAQTKNFGNKIMENLTGSGNLMLQI